MPDSGSRPRSRLIGLVAVLVIVVFAAQAAEAQRRRRRRRPPPPDETEQTAPPDAATPPNPFDAPGAAGAQGAQSPRQQGRPAPAGPGAPQATPPAAAQAGGGEEPLTEEIPEQVGPELGPLRTEFTSIMDELVQLRSTLAVLGRQLFRTKIRITIQNRAGDDNTLARIAVSLDGAPVFRDDGSGFNGEDGQRVFEGFAAPGPHVIELELEQRSRADDAYRYTMRDSYRLEAVRDQMTDVTIVLDDDSDIAEDFEDDGEGEYDVRTRVRVATRDLEAR